MNYKDLDFIIIPVNRFYYYFDIIELSPKNISGVDKHNLYLEIVRDIKENLLKNTGMKKRNLNKIIKVLYNSIDAWSCFDIPKQLKSRLDKSRSLSMIIESIKFSIILAYIREFGEF